MKKVLFVLVCLFALLVAGKNSNAQEVTITLVPGWNWISCPATDTLDFATALDTFTPTSGDVIKSLLWGTATYTNNRWRGGISKFYPGYGYMYKSNRTESVALTFHIQQSALQVTVTTMEPTDITTTSAVIGGTVTLGEGNHLFARGICWGTEPNPTIDGDHIAGDAVEGGQSFTLDGLTPGASYYVRAYVVTDYGLAYGGEMSFTTDHAYVDLGLPSGTLWATCNVGAENPEDYGDYFAWGETQPKDTYDWTTYQYCNGSSNTLTKYCNNSSFGYNGFTDNLTTLLPEDDAATANWGEGWRTATYDDWQELYDNTTVIWTTQNGVNGRLFTASNGNSIFLPAAGHLLESGPLGVGSGGWYWSSSLNMEEPIYAWDFHFNTDDYYMDYFGLRCTNRSIRPVRGGSQSISYVIDATVNPAEGGTIIGTGSYEQSQACTLTATANSGYTFVNWTENDEVVSTDATYTFTVDTSRTLVANFNLDHAYVDLGLPSGLLWATCNVGAENPEDYGDYFAWGETTTKDTYNWSTYQYCNGSSNTLTKYCNNSSFGYNGFTDNLTTLLPEDDAATANWDEVWRIPTKEEWQELYNNTTVAWTTQNGVNGRLFTASNGNSIFLPAAGHLLESGPFGVGSGGWYWSSSFNMKEPIYAWDFHFNADDYYMDYFGLRCTNRSIRPVREGSQSTSYVIDATVNPAEGGTIVGTGSYEQGQTCTLTATANSGYTFVNWTENDEVVSTDATYTFTVNADRNLVANFNLDHAYVDLGLPSGLLWATCNVGADNPEDYGDYFAWGETQPKETYDWSTYQYCNGDYNTLTKYCNDAGYGYNGFTDNLTTLLPEDDAAAANWGNGWRMPTQAELQELLDNTTVTWTTQNGVNGRLFTGSNGNSLFLPAAGYRGDELGGVGYNGRYWSSSLYMDDPNYAWCFGFISDFYDMGYYVGRDDGLSVRAVRSVRQN